MATISNFEDLLIFQEARKLSRDIYPFTRRGEFKYDTRFVQQIRAAAGSVMDNIAEGFERSGNKEFTNFLYIAKGSCGEVRSQLLRAHDVGYLSDEEFQVLYDATKKLGAGIMHFIQSLKNSEYGGQKYKKEN